MEKKKVVVLDGPAGAGKSSVAKELARRLDLPFLDTGAIYRAITLTLLRADIAPTDTPVLREKLGVFRISFGGGRVRVGDEDVTAAIRTPEIDREVSAYSAIPAVREALLEIQRTQATGGLVAEGRDMGTVVFPNADLKIFLTASPEERAKRRFDERLARGEDADYDEILAMVNRRDEIDSSRAVAPLKAADDAIVFDTTGCAFEEVVDRIQRYAEQC